VFALRLLPHAPSISRCPGYGDYANSQQPFGTSEYSAKSAVACLQYGLPYITSGFALMSLISTKPFDISSSVFNNDMLNCFSVMVLISMACGYLACLLERKNMHLGTVSRGAYWSIMNFLQSSENEPVSKKGRTLMIIMVRPPCLSSLRGGPLTRCVPRRCLQICSACKSSEPSWAQS
jgi:hypothetical protein